VLRRVREVLELVRLDGFGGGLAVRYVGLSRCCVGRCRLLLVVLRLLLRLPLWRFGIEGG
jgi:hypothetical protein